MKKIIASAGLVAVSTAGLQAAAPGLSPMETAKPWSISATLRGFYDDNYLSAHKSIEEDSFGFEIRPAASLNFPLEQSFIGLGYVYSMRYYEARENNSADHSHEFTLKADHRFSERYKLTFDDSFVYSQEPTIIDDEIITDFRVRTDSDAFRNRAAINFDAQLTELVGLNLGYQNNWYDYDQEGEVLFVDPFFGFPTGVISTRSGLLDRFEHYFKVEGRWHARENLFALLGYQLAVFDYTGDEIIAVSDGNVFESEDRNSVGHRVYVGAEHSFTTQFKVNGKVGAQYTDYSELGGDELSPWVDLSGTFTYLPGSYLQLGFRHQRNATDVANPEGNDLVKDQETSALYGAVHHRISPRLTGSLTGQFQRSQFNGGALDGDIDNFLLLGADLEYRFSPNWSTEVGYNFDRLDSDLSGRSFTRNRVYAGVRATY
jgi:hypothetical protein